MSELFKSKVGWLLAGIHLLIVIPCLLYCLVSKTAVLPVVILMILTFPWWIFDMFLPGLLGIKRFEPGTWENDLIFLAIMAVGGLINAFILYLLGFLLTRAFRYLSSRK